MLAACIFPLGVLSNSDSMHEQSSILCILFPSMHAQSMHTVYLFSRMHAQSMHTVHLFPSMHAQSMHTVHLFPSMHAQSMHTVHLFPSMHAQSITEDLVAIASHHSQSRRPCRNRVLRKSELLDDVDRSSFKSRIQSNAHAQEALRNPSQSEVDGPPSTPPDGGIDYYANGCLHTPFPTGSPGLSQDDNLSNHSFSLTFVKENIFCCTGCGLKDLRQIDGRPHRDFCSTKRISQGILSDIWQIWE